MQNEIYLPVTKRRQSDDDGPRWVEHPVDGGHRPTTERDKVTGLVQTTTGLVQTPNDEVRAQLTAHPPSEPEPALVRPGERQNFPIRLRLLVAVPAPRTRIVACLYRRRPHVNLTLLWWRRSSDVPNLL